MLESQCIVQTILENIENFLENQRACCLMVTALLALTCFQYFRQKLARARFA